MISSAPLTQLEELTENYLRSAFPQTITSAFFTYAAILLFVAGAGLFAFAVLRNKSAYINYRLTKKTGHYILAFLAVVLGLIQFIDLNGTPAVFFAVLSTLVGIIGAVGLLTRRKIGLVFSILSVWLSLPLKETPKIFAVFSDLADLEEYNAASKYAVYSADRMILGRVTVLALIAGALTIFFTAYYTKRRFLFRASYDSWFSELSLCPKCAAPLITEGPFCPSCGENVEDLPRSKAAWKPLDKMQFCDKCGKHLNKNGDCTNCDPTQALTNTVKEHFSDSAKDKIKYLITLSLVVVLFFIPVLRGESVSKLISGNVQINNDFVDRFNEWNNDRSLSKDEAWLKRYETASNELFELNARLFQANSDRMSYKALYGFIQYIEATYKQMAVLQKIDEAVFTGSAEDISPLGAYFNETLHLQQQALSGELSFKTSYAKTVENIIVDSLRYYLSFIPSLALMIALTISAAVALIAAVLLIIKHRDASPLETEAVISISAEEEKERARNRRMFIRKERQITAMGIGIAILFLSVCFLISTGKHTDSTPTVESCMHAVYTSDGASLISWISLCQTDPAQALENSEETVDLIDDCLGMLDVILQDPDADEALVSLSAELKTTLLAAKSELTAGRLPYDDTRAALGEQIVTGMKIDSAHLIEEALASLEDIF